MLDLTHIAELDISSASGLVALPGRLCVVADDEMFLSVYRLDGTAERRVPLWPGVLPEQVEDRKRLKPDAEATTLLPDGRLLVLGSGSTATRARGALVDPARDFSVREVELAMLWRALAGERREGRLHRLGVPARGRSRCARRARARRRRA